MMDTLHCRICEKKIDVNKEDKVFDTELCDHCDRIEFYKYIKSFELGGP